MKWGIVIVLTISFFIPSGREWLLEQGIGVQMFLHHFFHGNVFHLLVNILCVSLSFRKVKAWQFIPAYIISSLSVLISSIPVLGFSNMIYALIGVRSPSWGHQWWRHPGTLTFFGVTIVMLLFPNVSAVTHIVSFLGGAILAALVRWIKIIMNDSARYI